MSRWKEYKDDWAELEFAEKASVIISLGVIGLAVLVAAALIKYIAS